MNFVNSVFRSELQILITLVIDILFFDGTCELQIIIFNLKRTHAMIDVTLLNGICGFQFILIKLHTKFAL